MFSHLWKVTWLWYLMHSGQPTEWVFWCIYVCMWLLAVPLYSFQDGMVCRVLLARLSGLQFCPLEIALEVCMSKQSSYGMLWSPCLIQHSSLKHAGLYLHGTWEVMCNQNVFPSYLLWQTVTLIICCHQQNICNGEGGGKRGNKPKCQLIQCF